jgi:hypothetical protein
MGDQLAGRMSSGFPGRHWRSAAGNAPRGDRPVAGCVVSPRCVKRYDVRSLSGSLGPARVNALGLSLTGASLLVAGTWGMGSVLGLVVSVNLLDGGMQCGQIANQTRIFGLGESIRGRVNTIYMTSTFVGGALGALGGATAWTLGGWVAVCTLGGGLIAIAAGIFVIGASRTDSCAF